MVERVVDWRGGELRGVGRISARSPFATNGHVPGYVGIDCLAQAAAVLRGLEQGLARHGTNPELGYVVGIRKARFEARTLPLERELTTHVRFLGGAGSLAEYEAELVEGEKAYVSAVLSTFRIPGMKRSDE